MADEELNSPELPSSDRTEPEQNQGRVAELEGLVAQKDEALTKANAHISELEQSVANLDNEAATLKQAMAQSEEKLTEAVAGYKDLIIQSNPEVPEELVTGDTIEAINESLEKAKTLVSRVRQGLETEIASAKVPAGAPIRTPPDLSALSPREKINYAVGGKT